MNSQLWITFAYLFTLSLLAVWGVHRLWLLRRFSWAAELEPALNEAKAPKAHGLPKVTVQLPVYNESTVVARLIRAAAALDWPADRLEIQVLDDSTDETSEIIDRVVREFDEMPLQVTVIRRSDRKGFKAGALDYGMTQTDSDFLCVFDADFEPPKDFLRSLMPRFFEAREGEAEVGMVQARWEHSNRDESWLTRAQSALLDGHFVIEHKVRCDEGLFFNFNGTAGVWRRQAILEGGGWEHDTLTEDLDLSYRTQLAGWRFVYAPLVTAPAEIPPTIAAFKSQQHRWAKGSVQVARKLGWRVITSDEPWRIKREALAHLAGNSGYPLVLAMALLLPQAVLVPFEEYLSMANAHWLHLVAFLLCTASVLMFYERSQRVIGRPIAKRLRDTLAAVVLGIGMCVSQTRAVLEGLFQDTGVFVRTPKRGDGSKNYAKAWPSVSTFSVGLVEWGLAAWFAYGFVRAAKHELWGSLPFLLLFFSGFAWVSVLGVRDWWDARRGARPAL